MAMESRWLICIIWLEMGAKPGMLAADSRLRKAFPILSVFSAETDCFFPQRVHTMD
jgi:hypothetical protein